MAMPNRHSAISALPAILLVAKFPYWWAYIIGFIYAFWTHTIVDDVANEHWERSTAETIIAVVVLGSLFIFSWVRASIAWGWFPVMVMQFGALGQDLIDGGREYILHLIPIFPTHFGSKAFHNPWTGEEKFWVTMLMEGLAAVLIIFLSYMQV